MNTNTPRRWPDRTSEVYKRTTNIKTNHNHDKQNATTPLWPDRTSGVHRQNWISGIPSFPKIKINLANYSWDVLLWQHFLTKHLPCSWFDRRHHVPEAFIVPSIVEISRILEINRPNCQTWSDQDKARIVLRYEFIQSWLSDNSYRQYQTHFGLFA